MIPIAINKKISYMEASENPLSADIGIIKDNHAVWLYDVGNGENNISALKGKYNVVLSHFHKDHIGNIGSIQINDLYASKVTCGHLPASVTEHMVHNSLSFGNLRIFPLPSSHAKGCLALEIDETYTFVGDALYGKVKNNSYVYNAQLLKDEIDILKSLRSPFLMVSHLKGLIQKREEAIEKLEKIYKMRVPNACEIVVLPH